MKNFLFVRLAILAGFLSTGLWQASAASVSLKTNDALGTHSWAGSTNWDNGAVPAIANDYFTKNFTLRTPNMATNGTGGSNVIAFAGLSLSIDPGGQLLTKHFGNFTNLTLKLNGGSLFQGENFPVTNYGAIYLNDTTNSTITTDTQSRIIDMKGNIYGTGSSRLVISNLWGGAVLSGTNQFTNIVAITNAYVKLNNIQALGATNGGTVIGTLGMLDLNGINLTNENLTVTGGGTNGSIGAIINAGPALVNNGIRANVTMTGATTIGGPSRFDFMGPLTFAGGGFKLTKQGANEIGVSGISLSGVADLDVSAGQLTLLGNTTLGNAANTLNVLGGATLALFAHSSTVASPLSKVWVMQNNANFNQNNGTAVATGPMTLQGVANFGGGGTYLTNLGPVSGVGSVVKSGAHTLALVGTNSFTGNLTVNGGRLVLGPPATIYSAPVITVASGATLDVMPIPNGLALANGSVLQGSGVVTGAVVVSPSAAILPGGDGVAGTLLVTNGNVSFNHQSILRVDLSSASTAIDGGTNDLLVVNGNLNLSGSNIVLFSFLNGIAPAPGQYTIIRYSGSLTGSAANFISANYGATFDTTTPGEVRVTFTGSPTGTNLVWKGDGGGNLWNPALTPNWLNGGLPAVFFPGDFATFDDSGSNNVPVNLSGTLLPAGVLVNAAKDYIFAGSGSLNVGSLTKQGGGTLAISNANSYGGGTYVSGGTVRIGNANALGANTSLVVATNGGAIDLNGVDQSAKNFNYIASGTGPDGLGAIRNSANVSLDGARSGIRNLTLAGDTTVNTLANRFDLGIGGGVNGNGYKLTKTGPFILPFRGAVSNVSEFNVNAGRLYSEQFSLQLTSVVNVAAGASLGAYSIDGSGGNTNSAIINLNGGSLGAEGSQSVNSGPVVWTGLINVNADSILNPSQGNGNTDVRLENTLNGTRNLVAVPGAGARATILAANNDATFSGNWTINPSATLRLGGTAGSTGTGTVTNNGTVQFQRTAPSSFGGTIRGGGILEHMAGSEQLTLTGTSFANQLKVQSTNATKPLVLGAGSTTWVTNSLNIPNDNFYGRMQINPGATLNVLNGFFLGGEAVSRTGEVAQVGGDVTVSGQFRLAHWPTEISTYVMQGGTFTIPTLPVGSVNGGEINGGFYVGVDGVGLFTQSGGTINVPALVLDSRGSSVLGTATNTYSLEGGRLNLGVGGIKSGTTDATTTYQINLGGGTVGASADWTSSRVLNFSGTNGNVTFDTGPNTVTLSSYIYGAGGLNKQGPGALVVSGTTTYTNTTTLSGGTLLANGIMGTNTTANLTVNGGILGGSGQIRPSVIVNGGTLTAGTNGLAGTLVISNDTTLNAGARLLFDLASATTVGGGVNDLLLIRSNLTLNASTPVAFNFLNGAPNTSAPYTLAQVAGTMTGVPANLTAPAHYSAVFSVANGTNLQVQFGGAASNLTWIGDGLANLWDAGGALNWTNGVAMDFFGAGDIVNFNDDGSNNVPVTLVGNLAPSNIIVSANNSYNFAGGGRIVGASGLSKSGNGVLILTNAHDFTGSTLINGGSVVIGGDSSLGTAPAAYTPGKLVLNGGSVQAAGSFAMNPNRGIAVGPSAGTIGVNGGNVLISGAIITNNGAVNGALVKAGSSVLRLTGANAFTGDAIVSQGAVVIYNNNSLGSNNTVRLGDANTGAADVELLLEGQTTGFGFPRPIAVSAAAGGTVKIGSTFGAAANPQFNNSVTLNRDVTLVGTNTDRTTFAGQITGTGNINILGPNRVVLTAANTNNFVGNINVVGGTLQIGVASAVLNTIPDTSSVNVGDATWFNISVNAESIDALTGVGWVQGFSPATAPATLTIGASGGGGNFGGILTNGNSTLALTKAGAGTQTLSGRNTYTGNTVINGGVLALAATGSISNSAQISVNSNAVFDATASGGFFLGNGRSLVGNNGVIAGDFTVQSNATVSPNGFGAAGSLTFANNLILDRGAILNWNLTNVTTVGAGMNDLVSVNGDLVLNGTNVVSIFPLGGNLALGTYRLINYSGALVGSPADFRVFSGVATTRYTLLIDASTPGQINLVVGSPLAGNLAWRGNVNANWNINTDANWLNGLAADRFFNGDSVLFDETALQYSVGVPVTVIPGPVTVNSPYNYAFSGLGKINGSASITKNGAGILTLGNTNDFTGSITVNGGILRAGVSNAFGFSSGITVANGAQVDINGLAARAINYTMAGFGPDGRGALISGAGGPHGANICPVASVTLTGNAGIWSASGTVWDFFGGVFDAQGYSLTKLGPGRFDIFNTRTTNLNELIVREGIVYSEGNFGGVTLNDNFGTNATVYAGAVLAQFGNTFANTRITLNGGMLASSGNALNSVLWNGPINLASNSTVGYFNIFNSSGTYFSNHINIAGPISGPGSLTMVGTATNILYLAGTNTYTGNTVVQAGRVTLLPTGSISNSAVISIAAGASLDVQAVTGGFSLAPTQTLAGSGYVLGALSDNTSATIQPGGPATFGTLTVSNNLTLNGGGTLIFDLSSAATTEGGGVNDLLNVSNLTVNAPTTIRLNPLSGAFIASGTYTLVNYSGVLSGQGNLNAVTDMPGATATLDFSATGKIRVSVVNGSSTPLVWLGDLDFGNPIGIWDSVITPNWYDGSSQTFFTPGSAVTFNDDFNNSPTVNLIGSLAPGAIVVSSFDNQFSFIGSGSLGGGSLAKAGQSTMTLANSGVNNWSGPTDIRAGTLRVGNGGSIGALPATIITNNGTLIFNRADTITVGNTLVGLGATVQQGPGNLLLTGNNSASYIGSLYVYGGTLTPSSPLALGATNLGSAAITVATGGTLNLNGQTFGSKPVVISGSGVDGLGAVVNSGAAQLNALQFLSLSGDATIGGLNRWDVRGPVTAVNLAGSTLTKTGLNNVYFVQPVIGDGNIVLNQGVLGFELGATATNSPGSNGVIIANSGTLGFGNFGLRLNVNRPIVMNGGIFQGESGSTDADVDSPITLNTNTLFDIIVPTRLTNVISGSGRLIKGNSSVLVLAGENTYSGGTVVSAGILQIGTNGTGSIVGDIANNASVDFANTKPVVHGGAIIGSAGTINQSRGPVRLTRNISAVNVNVQGGFSNALTIATGTSNFISGTLSVGQGLATVGAAGSLIIEPGSVINSFNFMLGQQNTVTGQVAQLGGDVTVSAQFRVGHWPNEVSTYVMGGGSLTMTTLPANNPAGTSTAEQSGGFYIGIDGVGLFTQTGGVVTTHGLVMDNRGSSVLAGFANTYALEGGTLVLGTHGIQSGGASAANQNTAFNVYLGGGTIGSISNWTSPLAMTLTGTNGDVIFNPGSFTNTLNGILSGSGGLIKNGAGTLILGGNNTYFGQTRVNFGTLLYHGTLSASSGTLTVASGATLGGNGTISAPIVMNPGAIMAPGASIGTLTIGSPLALPSSTIMEISKLNGVLSSDILRTTGTLTYGGALTVVVLANAPAFAPGDTFRLFDAPAYAGSFASMNLPALTPGLVWNTTRIAIDGTIRVAFFDITPPMIICPANLTVACSADVPAANFAGGSATDNIDAVPVVTHVGDVSTGVNPRVIIRTYRASDSLGNTNDCAQTITVQDSIAPTITCPADITITANTNTCTAVVALGSPTANDNCTFTVTSNAPAIFPVGTTLVIWTATDSAGNTTTCTQRVKVLDSTLAITASPQDTTNTLGTTATFSVTAAGCPTLTYQWFFLGTNLLADATNATLTLTNIQLSQAGGYSVVVANGGGSVTSAVAVLSLNLPPIAGANGGVAQQGRTATLFVTKFLANDSDPDGDALSVTAVSATSTNGGGVVLSGGEVLYTPLPGFVGNDLFTYTLSDGRGGTATGNVEMYVIDGNVPGANKISMTMLPNGHVLVRFAGVPGRAYEIQRSLNLMSWSRLSTLTAPAHGIIEFEDTTPPMGGAFYRIALP